MIGNVQVALPELESRIFSHALDLPLVGIIVCFFRALRVVPSGNETGDDGDQNMQGRKESFLAKARAGQIDDYLKATRIAPLSRYEIKAGWEIPAVLEQALNSDLPGELKALVSSNVYDTATGRFRLWTGRRPGDLGPGHLP
jgi:hypothetical protein